MNAPVHHLDWIAPTPLWARVRDGDQPADNIARPALLRFATDAFMDELFNVMQRDPARVSDYLVQAETWRGMPQQPGREELLAAPRPLANRARTLKTRAMARLGIGGGLLAQTAVSHTPAVSVKPPLKLYQPAHQRYYLVSASLVCQRPGFPDHAPDNGKQERAGFVLRRLMPPNPLGSNDSLPQLDLNTWDEYAWVDTPQGPGWQKLGQHQQAAVLTQAAGEELLPLFPLGFNEPNGFRRTMLAGLVPVGRREQYLGGRKLSANNNGVAQSTGASPRTARMAALRMQVTEPWKRLIETAERTRLLLADPNNTDSKAAGQKAEMLKVARDQIQHSSWLILLELADFLKTYLNPLWVQIKGSGALSISDPLKNVFERQVFNATQAASLVAGTVYPAANVKASLRDALLAITAGEPTDPSQPLPTSDTPRNRLESALDTFSRLSGSTSTCKWPDFLFPLADPALPWLAAGTASVDDLNTADQTDVDGPSMLEGPKPESGDPVPSLRDYLASVDKLLALLVRQLPINDTTPAPAVPAAAEKRLDFRDGWFVIRCVLSRPNCAPIHPHIVSAATEPFQLASFFDPDAPARPIRIALPFDTTPAGLRKFNKNTAFEISNILCGQVQRAKGLGFGDLVMSVLPWPFHKDLDKAGGGPCQTDSGLAIGMICSLSIPIITLCAFILLIIMISLLDIIFRWLPWFITCFPVPGLKGKRS